MTGPGSEPTTDLMKSSGHASPTEEIPTDLTAHGPDTLAANPESLPRTPPDFPEQREPFTTRLVKRIRQSFRGYWTVRTRVLGAVLALSALGLIVAGTTAYALQRNDLNATMDNSLERSFGEFGTLLETGIDPQTREDFVLADQLVYLVMQRTLTAPNEGMMGVKDGEVVFVANSQVGVRLETDQELVDYASSQAASGEVFIRTVRTPITTYRALVVPVQLADDATSTQFVLAIDVEAERAQLDRTFATFAFISFGTLVFIGVVGWLLVGRLLMPIRLLTNTAQGINDSDLSQRIQVSGRDDLSDLTRTVNAMLERLEGSFTSQRQLLDDVGHELRTPITIVQGHLELQDSSDPHDVQAVRDVALDELDRMRLLVDDLVTLAGVARPDFVRLEPVNVGRLTDDVLDKARTLGNRRWTIDARAETMTRLDPRRVTQAWLQLTANAVKFSEEGSTVAVGSRRDADGIRLWIRDEGVGIAREDQTRIFDRFTRGVNGRRTEGSGLGLTIVSAIAAAHGGEVELMSAPDQGSTFTLVIPLSDGMGPHMDTAGGTT
ncbi:HAMP domain-containing sensor histidine kinase [Arthrobacter sp. H5]|uniref:sensor histidine kinase n=1 Tax=Arthrobacter sp. H5 TaxID=1267973 RepID=UPI0020A66FB8|nr:HAMP domain-containing sensor histidine kinase [Arthrobacter sp. H5]